MEWPGGGATRAAEVELMNQSRTFVDTTTKRITSIASRKVSPDEYTASEMDFSYSISSSSFVGCAIILVSAWSQPRW
jgi:hypothetical protein